MNSNDFQKLQDIGERELIRLFSQKIPSVKIPGLIGIGDDCAAIPLSNDASLLVTCDTLVEGIHFLKNASAPESIGYKALAVNVSDIAAMGGDPQWAFLSLALPPMTSVSWVMRFFEGFQSIAQKYPILLMGGDTTSSPDSIVITVTLIGSQKNQTIKKRSEVVVGDIIAVTDTLGNSAVGLQCLLNSINLENDLVRNMLRSHFFPIPPLAEGQWLAQHPEVHAMIDVSDGPDIDLAQLVEQSHVGIDVDIDTLPLSNELQLICKENEWDPYTFAATGGEDYVLIVAIDSKKFNHVNNDFFIRFGKPLTAIGKATNAHKTVRYQKEKKEYTLLKRGYEHFKKNI